MTFITHKCFDDFSRVKRIQISFHNGCMSIKVDKSKNDQLRQGDEVLIAEGEGTVPTVCAVTILKEYLTRFNIDPFSEEFIFMQLIKKYKLASGNRPITNSTFRDHFCKTQALLFSCRRNIN